MTSAQVVDGAHWNTRTEMICTFLATPTVVPPTVPATCVPWNWLHGAQPMPHGSKPQNARPTISWWFSRIPVSMMKARTVFAVFG